MDGLRVGSEHPEVELGGRDRDARRTAAPAAPLHVEQPPFTAPVEEHPAGLELGLPEESVMTQPKADALDREDAVGVRAARFSVDLAGSPRQGPRVGGGDHQA